MADQKRTEIDELGEFGLINKIKSKFDLINESSHLGIGDDAAVIDCGDFYQLVSTDMLLEGVHFDLSYTPLTHLGYKAVAVNVSDIAAMNGIPQQITISIGISNRFSGEAVEALYEGIKFACEAYKVDLVGGDTTSSRAGLVISVTAIGRVDKDKVAYRSGAQKSDILCVTGDLGGAFMGLQVLEREKQVFLANPDMQPKLDDYDYLVKRQLRADARMDIIHELADLGVKPSAMIDISDGLASEAFHLCESSGLGVVIYEDKLPIATDTFNTAVEFNMDPMTCALNGGEDYELLFTISQDDYEKLKNHADIATVGYMQEAEKGRKFVTKNENVIDLKAQGWKHF